MATKIGINGFGRIGRLVLRTILERHPDELEVVGVNDLFSTKINAHLFKHDSTYGDFKGDVSYTADSIIVNGKAINRPTPTVCMDRGMAFLTEDRRAEVVLEIRAQAAEWPADLRAALKTAL